MSSKNQEDLCRRCGRCCYAKVVSGDVAFFLETPCPYLNIRTNLCSVYERRFVVNPFCLTVAEGIKARIFPDDCPYVQGIKGYKGPISWREWNEQGKSRQSAAHARRRQD